VVQRGRSSQTRGGIVFAAALAVCVAVVPVQTAHPAPVSPHASGAPLTIDVVWDDPTSAVLVPSTWVGEEVREQFDALGVRVRWRHTKPQEGEPAEVCWVIVLGSNPLEYARSRGTMGFTQRDSVSRSVWLLLAAVDRAIGLPVRPATPLSILQRRDLARALGRVAAHELVHVLAPGHAHASSGLMQARLNRRVLTETGVRFDPGTGAALRAALLPATRVAGGPALPWAGRLER
jgi:hypothetical protein